MELRPGVLTLGMKSITTALLTTSGSELLPSRALCRSSPWENR